jgi:hypothetical protein
MARKRRITTKRIGQTEIITNPRSRRDREICVPTALLAEAAGKLHNNGCTWLYDSLLPIFKKCVRAGIAIGRAKATASGRQRRRKAKGNRKTGAEALRH